jgi:hypothetical protein
MTSTTITPPFEAGDHVVLPCLAAGLIPYEHHAIVVSVVQEIDGEWTMCVSDFTIDGDDDGGGGGCCSGGGIGMILGGVSGGGGGGGSGSARSLARSSFASATASMGGEGGGGDDTPDPTGTTARDDGGCCGRGGLRLLCVDAGKWRRIDYDARDNIVDDPALVRRRVSFLLGNPGILPRYSLVESNCECVAVWCKTGRWSTLQFSRWAGGANLASRVAVAGGLSAAYCSMIVPGGAFLLAAGMIAEIATGVWCDRARRGWETRTSLLNDEFDRSAMEDARFVFTTDFSPE